MSLPFNWDGLISILGYDYFDAWGRLSSQYTADKVVIVLFYSPSCIHCKNIYPIYNRLAKESKNKDIVYAVVDVSSNSQLFTAMNGWTYKINGFPTIVKYINNTYSSIYNGNRTVEDLQNYSDSKSQKRPLVMSKAVALKILKWTI